MQTIFDHAGPADPADRVTIPTGRLRMQARESGIHGRSVDLTSEMGITRLPQSGDDGRDVVPRSDLVDEAASQ